MTITTVALVGASGALGPYILEALQSSTTLQVTVLVRESSKATFPTSVRTRSIPDHIDTHEPLVSALQDQDALVLAYSGSLTTQSKLFIDAAIKAGVRRIIPADYGSCDSSDARSLELVPLYKEKEKAREYLIAHEGQGSGHLSWTSLVNGHFFDQGLQGQLLGFDLSNKKVKIFDDGQKIWSATTRDSVGMAVRRILEVDEDESQLRNKLVYVQGMRTNQIQLARILEEVTGSPFSKEHVSSDKFIEEHKRKLYKPDGTLDMDIVEELVCVEGIVNADWQDRPTLVNELLGIEVENVETVVRRILDHK